MTKNSQSKPTSNPTGRVHANIPYKESLGLDLYTPNTAIYEKSPTLIYVHGGAWLGGYKESVKNNRFNDAFSQLRSKGYTIISPEYTLGKYGKPPFPVAIEDIFDAINWVVDHAEEYQLDPNNIGILGESAGGQLSLLSVYANENKYQKILKVTPRYFINVYSPADLEGLYLVQKPRLDSIKSFTSYLPESWRQKADLNQYLFGFDPEEQPQKFKHFIEKYSPIENIVKVNTPVMVIHGDLDKVVPLEQSKKFVGIMRKKGGNVEFLVLPGVNHGLNGIKPTQHEKLQNRIQAFVLSHYQQN